MQDAYNLGWKIASVIKKKAHLSILSTYESERREIALQLIDFDRKFSRMFSGKPARDIVGEAGISMAEFKDTFEKGNSFTSGLSVRYGPNMLVSNASHDKDDQPKTKTQGGIELGMRFPSFQVVSQADATPMQLGDSLKSDGRWRLVVFAGDVTQPSAVERLRRLGDELQAVGSFWHRLLAEATVEPILVHASARRSVEMFDLHSVFYFREHEGYDYYRIFADDESYHHGHGHAYANYGVDPDKGRSVLIRPDQYVGWGGAFDDLESMERYLSAIML